MKLTTSLGWAVVLLTATLLLSMLPTDSHASNVQKPLDYSKLEENQRNFLYANKAIKANDRKLIAKYKKKLKGYSLYPYVNYLDFHRHISSTPNSSILHFIEQNKDTYLANRLKRKWLKKLGKKKQWTVFSKHYQQDEFKSQSLTCYAMRAELSKKSTSKNTNILIKQIRQNWLSGHPLPSACKPLEAYLLKKGQLSGSLIWKNIILAMNKRQLTYAKKLSRHLSKKDRKFFQSWLKIDKTPLKMKNGLSRKMPILIKRAAFALTIKRMARRHHEQARKTLQRFEKAYKLSASTIQELNQLISLKAAFHYPDNAKDLLYEVNQSQSSQDTLRWQLQVALRQSDWPTVLETYKLLTPEQQNKPKWQYWSAKALLKTGDKKIAKQRLTTLSKTRDYYGFLAADVLKTTYKFNLNSAKTYDSETYVKKYGQLQRIKELLAIRWTLSANREWHHLLTNIEPDEIQAISYIAKDWKQHSVAIRGAAKSKDWNNIPLRFPTPYNKPVMQSASKNKIDPAWIYGIMRRESSFSTDIRSPVGATGLMQLMPATAKFIGKRIGVDYRTYRNLTHAGSNIKLGSAYLNYLYQRYNNNRILATAAYNAGPGNVDSWLPKGAPLPADQWVETILFSETRKYVKAVMEYTVIFQSLLNQKYDRLETYMTPIHRSNIQRKKSVKNEK